MLHSTFDKLFVNRWRAFITRNLSLRKIKLCAFNTCYKIKQSWVNTETEHQIIRKEKEYRSRKDKEENSQTAASQLLANQSVVSLQAKKEKVAKGKTYVCTINSQKFPAML